MTAYDLMTKTTHHLKWRVLHKIGALDF